MQSIASQRHWPLHDLTAFQRDELALVAGLTKPHGLEIKGELETAYDNQEIHHGRLYPNLDTLVEKGLVEKGERDRRTNVYHLTRRGRDALRADLAWRLELLGIDPVAVLEDQE